MKSNPVFDPICGQHFFHQKPFLLLPKIHHFQITSQCTKDSQVTIFYFKVFELKSAPCSCWEQCRREQCEWSKRVMLLVFTTYNVIQVLELMRNSVFKIAFSYVFKCWWKKKRYFNCILGSWQQKWSKMNLQRVLKNSSHVWHIHTPIQHISLSCHWSSLQVHVECPILRGSEGARSTHEAESHFFLFLPSPLSLSLPQFSTFDKLTPKPCFIPAPQAENDTSFRWRSMHWLTHYCWWTEGARLHTISQPEAVTGLSGDGESRMGSHNSKK